MSAEVDGRPAGLGGPRQRAVLAVLLIARGRVVAADRIVADVWEGCPPPSPTTLHAYISGLRKALEPGRETRAPAGLLVREGPGYALRAAPGAVDAERFTDLAGRGKRALEGGDHALAEDLLGRALGLWRGPAYADFAEAGFAVPEVTRLEDLRATVHEDHLAAMIELGRHTEAVGPLEALVAEQPLRERGWELFALGLYRSGRQADALSTLRTVRRRLADELGIEPGHALRSLETAMLNQDPRLDPVPVVVPGRSATGAATGPPHAETETDTGTEAESGNVTGTDNDTETRSSARSGAGPGPVSGSPQRAHTGNLPYALSSFVGRTDDLAAVQGLLAEHRLVTLTGPGGVGKTRLALETARGRTGTDEDGPWLVELAGLHAPELLPAAVAMALGIPGVAGAEQLAAVIADRRLVLVLDNCEHLLGSVAELAGMLLGRCGGLRVLATSREPLGVEGEAGYVVPPLDPEGDAAELFRRRAASVLPGWEPDPAELVRITALCAELDGIPLAIELAAAQCRMLSIDQIADALEDRFALLVGGTASGPERHRTLEDTVAWSHQLLNPAERRLFHRLGVFAAGFDLEAAGAVGGVEPVLPTLSALVRKSLVTVEPGTAPRRYRMLETLRRYALRELGRDELARAQERHRTWVLARAESAERLLRGPEAADMMARLSRDQPEIRAAFASALAAGDGEYGLKLGGALCWFWYRMGHISEGLSWLSESFASAPGADPGTRARARAGLAGMHYLAGQIPPAYEAALLGADEARAAGDVVTEGILTIYRAQFAVFSEEPTDPMAIVRAGVEIARRSSEQWLVADALMVQGGLARALGDASASEVLQEAIETARGCGHHWSEVSAGWFAMKLASDGGDEAGGARALAIAEDLMDSLESSGDVTSWLVLLHSAAYALALTGRPADAAVLMGAVEGIGRRYGFSPERMDPVDGPREAAGVRAALPAEEYERHAERGRALSRPEVNALLTSLLPGR